MSSKPLLARPRAIREVAQRVNAGHAPFRYALAEMLDEVYKMPPAVLRFALAFEPEPLNPENEDYEFWQDAYLAGVAEHLARGAGLPVPVWVEEPGRFLERPYFANGGLESLKAMLLAESPVSFRRRMIFVEGRPLRRA
jgi:hypothetical protein